jgi:nucleotide-binding universal stress UspA family protein
VRRLLALPSRLLVLRHAPLRERMFGGATRSVLALLPAPVLMAQ